MVDPDQSPHCFTFNKELTKKKMLFNIENVHVLLFGPIGFFQYI